MNWIRKHRLYLAWVISLTALFSSLYYGEVLHFEPCRLCWYQRIAMFPMALFLGIAFYKEDFKIARCCMPLIAIGAFLSFYQSMSQIFPTLEITSLCGEATSCTTSGIGPYLSFLAFAALLVLNKDS